MKKGTTTPILLLVLGILLAFPAAAGEPEEATLDVLISTIESNKKALIAVNLGLDDEEAQAFWPIYDRYEGELSAIRTRLAALIDDYTKNFATLSDE